MADITLLADVSDIVRARKEISAWARQSRTHIDVVNERMRRFGASSELAFNQFGRAASRAQTASRRFATFGLQQAGYQVGDFFVQIQSGTNALVAFGQQASQMLGIFGAGGAIAGAGVAIATAILHPLLRANEELDTFQDKIDEITKQRRTLEFGFASPEQTEQYDRLSRLIQLLVYRRQELNNLTKEGHAEGSIEIIQARDAIALAEQRVKSQRDIIASYEEEIRKLKQAKEIYPDIIGSAEGLKQAIDAQLELWVQANKNALELEESIGIAAVEALKLAGVDITSGISSAASAAAVLAANLGSSLEFAARIGSMANAARRGDVSQIPGEGASAAVQAQRIESLQNQWRLSLRGPRGGGGGGGGGSSVDPIAEIRKQLELERKLLGVEEARAKIIRRLGPEYENYSQSAINSLVALQEANERVSESIKLQEQALESVQSNMENNFMSIIDGSKSAKEAFGDMVRYIINEAVRIQFVQPLVQSITGGLFGGGFGFGLFGARASGGPVMPGKPYLVGESGPELFIPGKRGTVANSQQTQTMAKGGGETHIVVELSPELEAKILRSSAQQSIAITSAGVSRSRNNFGNDVQSVQSRGTT